MRISERTHPVLNILKLGDAPDIGWHITSKSFKDAALQSREKLLTKDILSTLPDGRVSLIMSKYRAIDILIKRSEDDETICMQGVRIGDSPEDPIVQRTFFLYYGGQEILYYSSHSEEDFIPFYEAIICHIFTLYAEVETKFLPANSKVKGIDCKYINDTNNNITYLDSKWFTTLVKSDAFKVRGHFRLQPCGEGLKDRKLIWINEFTKEGYTAPARKLSEI